METIGSRIGTDIRHFGIARTAYEVLIKAVSLFLDLRIIRVFKNELFDAIPSNDGGCRWQFLDENEMFDLAQNPDSGLSESFVQTALDKGDECFGGFDGKDLACYCWYSHQQSDEGGLTFHFPPHYIYQYAAVTYSKYRGRRLAALRGQRARHEYIRRGFKGLVFAVDSHNFRSMQSMSHGARQIGYIFVLKIGKHAWIHNSLGCRKEGVFLAKPDAVPEPVPALDGEVTL